MPERELDSSINDYIETKIPKNYVKQLQWDMAIGFQEVDNNSFLIKFYENLLLGKNNNLHSRDLIVEELFNKEN